MSRHRTSRVAHALGVGFVEIRKDRKDEFDDAGLLRRATPPDYRQRDLALALRKGLLGARDQVLSVRALLSIREL